jgi:hypothetical protein
MATPTRMEDVIEALNIFELPEEEQEELLNDLNELIFKGTLVRLLERMNDKTREEFSQLLEQDAPEEVVEAFIEKHVVNADSAVEDAIIELRDDILAVTKG